MRIKRWKNKKLIDDERDRGIFDVERSVRCMRTTTVPPLRPNNDKMTATIEGADGDERGAGR